MPLWNAPTVGFFSRGTGGAPTDGFVRAVEGMTSYEHSLTNAGGYETMTIQAVCSTTMAFTWLQSLMMSAVAYGPDGVICFEGYLTSVEATIGAVTLTSSLDGMANRLRCRYTTVLGSPGVTSSTTDTASTAIYGVKDQVVSLGTTTSAEATALAAATLAAASQPRATQRTALGSGQAANESRVTLTVAGWYSTLDWVLTSRTDTSTEEATAQVTALLGTVSPGIGATNDFLEAVRFYSVTGITATRAIDPDTPYRTKIETLLNLGTTSNQRISWGVWNGREFIGEVWAGATPTSPTYYISAQARTITDAAFGTVQPWSVRPDAMVYRIDIHDPTALSSAVDATIRFYCGRVTCRWGADGWSVDLEPDERTGLDARLARIGS